MNPDWCWDSPSTPRRVRQRVDSDTCNHCAVIYNGVFPYLFVGRSMAS